MSELALAPTTAASTPVPAAPGRGPAPGGDPGRFDRVLSRAGAAIEARRPAGRTRPDDDHADDRPEPTGADDGTDPRAAAAAAVLAPSNTTPDDHPAPPPAEAGGATALDAAGATPTDGSGPHDAAPIGSVVGGEPWGEVGTGSPEGDPLGATGPGAGTPGAPPTGASPSGSAPAGATPVPRSGPVPPEAGSPGTAPSPGTTPTGTTPTGTTPTEAADPAGLPPRDGADGAAVATPGADAPAPEAPAPAGPGEHHGATAGPSLRQGEGQGAGDGAAPDRSGRDATPAAVAEAGPPLDLAPPTPLDGAAPTAVDPAAAPRPSAPTTPAPPVSTAAAPAPPPEPSAQLAHALGTLRHLTDGSEQIEVRLHPEELGEVLIEVTATGGQLRISLVAERAETRDRLQADLGQLAARLAESGLQASSLDVGTRGDGRSAGHGDRLPARAGLDRFRAGGALTPALSTPHRPAGSGRLDLIL